MWPFKSKSSPDVSASHVAEKLYLVAVNGETETLMLKLKNLHLDFSKDKEQLFLAKYIIFCEAAVLRVLLTEKQKNEALIRAFERLVFGSTPTDWAAVKVETIKSAMKSLDELFTQQKELTWSRNWLLDIGYDETNPATLTALALLIGNNTRALREFVPKFSQVLAGE
ncbi:MAG TPA: hypothetical protein VGX95_05830 [Xanthobacteraceae bacterium]|jgi:hypothetical protein|nr:hypothetical protein [Xanthobacteraceae bacterium]